MANSTELRSNWTLTVTLSLLPPAIICFGAFLYIMAIILKVYVTTPNIRDSARYVLFAHMLISDTLYLVVGFSLLMTSLFAVTILIPICYILVTLGSSSFRVTPYILAAMALERYISVCFPLRHIELCTRPRSNAAVLGIWVVGLIPNAMDFISLMTLVQKDFFSQDKICSRHIFDVSQEQNLVRKITLILSTVLVGLIILYTYVSIMVVAWKIGSGKSSASKAARTVIIHTFQLLLCLSSLYEPLVKKQEGKFMIFLQLFHFLVLTCLPRFLSPLIYGIRDEFLRKCILRNIGLRVF
ncbi:odorant receptor 131-2-like [Dendropsophus ebraccatus]|uniref:odorant receptor 131-2-like n=1 Tax=Dendropsophus ebraccatus TaxID=150705 RepID=UPI003831B8CB